MLTAGARSTSRRRWLRIGAGALLAVAIACGPRAPLNASPAGASSVTGGREAAPGPAAAAPQYAVGLRVLRFTVPGRTISLRHGHVEPLTLTTYVRYPALGASHGSDGQGAPAAGASGPFPLIVFAHGFDVTPATYARLLDAWARAGYVVAAPLFPLTGAGTPGGPEESDVVNQPGYLSIVISRLVEASALAAGPMAGLIDPAHIGVAGQSDGGETVLALADSRRLRDPRIAAAVVLSGAELSGIGGYNFTPGGPPLLAAQGTADPSNEPRFTYAFFKAAQRPKYLLRLLGAEHLPPYTREQPYLGVVERVSVAFFDAYLKRSALALQQLGSLGDVSRVSTLLAEP